MQTFATVLASFAAISAVSGSPILARDVCGSAPAGTGAQTPLEQPSGIQTAEACLAKCNANGQCQSFVFGMVDNVIKCMLFNVPGAQVPKQDTNLIVFDKACSSVPAVVPTTANPTGKAEGATNNGNGQQQQGQQQQGQQQQGQQQQGQAQQQQQGQGNKVAARDTCGATPAGPATNPATPLSQPANIQNQADCLAQCKANPSCKSFTFGNENNQPICKLFNVAAASVPAPSNGQDFKVFDVGCSI